MVKWRTDKKGNKFPVRMPKSLAPKLPERQEVAAYIPFSVENRDNETIVIGAPGTMTDTQKAGSGYFVAPRRSYKDPDEALEDVLMEIKLEINAYPQDSPEWYDLETGKASNDPTNLPSWNKKPKGWKTTGAHFSDTVYDSQQDRYWSISGSVLRTKGGNWIADAEVEDITGDIA